MSRLSLTSRGKAAGVEPAKAERPRAAAKARQEHRHGFRLSPGEVAREREAERYAADPERGLVAGARQAPQSRQPGGEALPEPLQQLHEVRLGRSLDELRVHRDPAAAREAGALGAQAFAEEGDLFFAAGRYRPDRPEGQVLIAHEVAHAAQQADGRAAGPALQADEPNLRPEIPAPVLSRSEIGALSASVFFGQGDFLLPQAGAAAIEELRRGLSGMASGARVVIDAYASGEGTEDFNQRLSEMRRFAVVALLTQGVTVELDVSGTAAGESRAATTETGTGARELQAQRAQNRRVDIVILPNSIATPEPPGPERRLDLELPPIPPPSGPPDLGTVPSFPEPESLTFCGLWQDPTRRWFDRRLRELGIGEDLRGILADLGVGAVEKLAFTAVEEAIGQAGAGEHQTEAIITALRAACQQELRR